ncbi:DUF711 domain-containing protein [Kibdelosporangium persicum]|nr:DUF711 family protein [Kibdelosporangium persicum]
MDLGTNDPVSPPRRPPIRTLTFGIADVHPIAPEVFDQTAQLAKRMEQSCQDAGYEVQTLRLSTRPIFEDLTGDIVAYARALSTLLTDLGLPLCSVGPAPAADPRFPLERLDVLGDMLIEANVLTSGVQLATAEHGIRVDAALPAARIMRRLAMETKEGLGNFRFAALACVEPGGPFFPASYHTGPAAVTIGLQGAGIVAEALADVRAVDPPSITRHVRAALIEHATPIVGLAQRLAGELGVRFGGIDLSPAPAGDDSIAAAVEQCGHGPIGSPGSLSIAAALTEALRTTGLPTTGYTGLMLPVCEDKVLADRWADGHLSVHQLLCLSAVCGTGLDTVPLPGDTSPEQIAHILLDVASLAYRLRKPLSARLFPVPGARPGDRTSFSSPYLVNTTVRP